MTLNITIPEAGRRAAVLALSVILPVAISAPLHAQSLLSDSTIKSAAIADSARVGRRHFYRKMAAGIVTSILLHESAHFAASYLMGFRPHLGFYKGRPTVFSGIDDTTDKNKHKQFIFSAAGLTVQDVLDEMVLDIPHQRGSAFERGLLAAAIGTTLFYVTIGRNARVSDISVMARTSTLSKTQLSLIFGSVSALHAFRIGRDEHYAHFFAAPSDRGGIKAGVSLTPK